MRKIKLAWSPDPRVTTSQEMCWATLAVFVKNASRSNLIPGIAADHITGVFSWCWKVQSTAELQIVNKSVISSHIAPATSHHSPSDKSKKRPVNFYTENCLYHSRLPTTSERQVELNFLPTLFIMTLFIPRLDGRPTSILRHVKPLLQPYLRYIP